MNWSRDLHSWNGRWTSSGLFGEYYFWIHNLIQFLDYFFLEIVILFLTEKIPSPPDLSVIVQKLLFSGFNCASHRTLSCYPVEVLLRNKFVDLIHESTPVTGLLSPTSGLLPVNDRIIAITTYQCNTRGRPLILPKKNISKKLCISYHRKVTQWK